jgi:hypothetical protein
MEFWLFFRALWKHWWALMSSAVFTGLGVYAAWQGKTNHWVVAASIIAGVGLFYFAAFRSWKEEHKKCEDEIAKRGQPQLTAEFMVFDNPPRTVLMLYNSSDIPAVNLFVQEIRHGSKVLQFFVPKPVRSGPGTWVDSWILENGRHDENDIMAFFSGMEFVGQMSTRFDLRVTYSSQDSRSSARSWVLFGYFYYDRLAGKICMPQQYIEAV